MKRPSRHAAADEDYYAAAYTEARAGFRAAARAASAELSALRLEARGPDGEALSIDIAWLGSRAPRRVLLHSCGLHGVEAFAGSAVQRAALAAPPSLPAQAALVLVHVLNPFGMAWLRRANEHNVDLNRNFLEPDEPRAGAPDGYRLLNALLNPDSPPAPDRFYARALLHILRHGFGPLKQAVAAGQYEYERGLFFGGRDLEQGPALYRDWVREHLAGAERVLALDVHTGLGHRGRETLFAETAAAHARARALAAQLGRRLSGTDPDKSIGYRTRGGLGTAMPAWLPRARVAFLTQEFGTYPPLQVLHALREENRWHHDGGGDLHHPSQARLREMFCPADPNWRQAVLTCGLQRLQRATASLGA